MSLPQITKHYYLPEFGSFRNYKVTESQVSPPKPHEVLVKVHAVSLQYRDMVVAAGSLYPPKMIQENLVPCSDMAGEVIALGEGVKSWKLGDRVCANFASDHIYGDTTLAIQNTSMGGQAHGCLTQYRTFPAHALVKVPEHFSYEEASTLPAAALTAYNSLRGPTPVKAGDYVLVLGTGGVSIFGLQFALASGARVIVTSSSDEKLKIAQSLGAQHVINYKTTPDWDDEVLKITNGVGVDHVLEVGGQGTLSKSINAVRMAGWVHVIGFVSKDAADINIVGRTIRKGILLRGIQVGSIDQFKDMVKLIEANPKTTKPLIDKVFNFDEAVQAFEHLESQKHVGKIVVRVA